MKPCLMWLFHSIDHEMRKVSLVLPVRVSSYRHSQVEKELLLSFLNCVLYMQSEQLFELVNSIKLPVIKVCQDFIVVFLTIAMTVSSHLSSTLKRSERSRTVPSASLIMRLWKDHPSDLSHHHEPGALLRFFLSFEKSLAKVPSEMFIRPPATFGSNSPSSVLVSVFECEVYEYPNFSNSQFHLPKVLLELVCWSLSELHCRNIFSRLGNCRMKAARRNLTCWLLSSSAYHSLLEKVRRMKLSGAHPAMVCPKLHPAGAWRKPVPLLKNMPRFVAIGIVSYAKSWSNWHVAKCLCFRVGLWFARDRGSLRMKQLIHQLDLPIIRVARFPTQSFRATLGLQHLLLEILEIRVNQRGSRTSTLR